MLSRQCGQLQRLSADRFDDLSPHRAGQHRADYRQRHQASVPGPDLAHDLRPLDRGGQRAAFIYSLIVTAKLNDVDPQAWLADVLARIADTPQHRLDELLPWNWRQPALLKAA